jgi:putative lysine transport system permease protein
MLKGELLFLSFFTNVSGIFTQWWKTILLGIVVTLALSVIGTIVGLLIALPFGVMRVKKIEPYDTPFVKALKKVGKAFVGAYVTFFRGTPMMVQATLFYYGFSLIGIDWSAFVAGLFTVSLNTAAYLTEIIRSGLLGISDGQKEAGGALGMNNQQVFWSILFPQALKRSMAAIGNEMIINIKDTSVFMCIGVMDLYNSTVTAGNDGYHYVESMIIAAAIYLVLTVATSKILEKVERHIGAPTKELTSSN